MNVFKYKLGFIQINSNLFRKVLKHLFSMRVAKMRTRLITGLVRINMTNEISLNFSKLAGLEKLSRV